ncbi:hypothetical protein V5799_031057 [Amblyomma americanum]|uniref:Uncharacterized protein n=1 Tax=Amblyomma americanum TaxID=6943 RepID=A0AAQ4ELL3_AMBAM
MRTCKQRHSSSACRVILLSGGFGFSISVPPEEDVAIHNGSGEQCIPDDQETATHSADRLATPEPLASDLEHASTHQALLNRISQLERRHEESQRKLGAAKRRYLKSEEEKERLKSKFKHIFSDDQMKSMERLSAQGMRWEASTLVKSLKLRPSCGSQGYSLLRNHGFPLPSERTLQRHLENFKFQPGLLQDMIEPLRMKVY